MDQKIRSLTRIYALSLLIPLLVLFGQTSHAQNAAKLPDYVIEQYGAPPPIPQGRLSRDVKAALNQVVDDIIDQASWDPSDTRAFNTLVAANDPRLAWLMTDMLRFTWRPEFDAAVRNTALSIVGIEPRSNSLYGEVVDHLIAWDVPAYPGYLPHKRDIFTNYIQGWEKIFVKGDIKWEHVSWGGVNIDNRQRDG